MQVHRMKDSCSSEPAPAPAWSRGVEPVARTADPRGAVAKLIEMQALRFASDVSHELTTPLAVLRLGLEDLLRRDDLAPEVIESIGSLLETSGQMTTLCRDLLLLARVEAGRLELDCGVHDLCDLIASVMDDMRILGERRGLQFEVELPARAEALVDARHFGRILLNVLSNAVKYNVPGGIVRLQVLAEENAWSILISNTGEVITPEHQPLIFERFSRAPRGPDGHGLGLSLSRELARAHGGELGLVSSEAGWTTFRVTVPKAVIQPACLRSPQDGAAGTLAGA